MRDQNRIFRFIMSLTMNADEAEELLQQVSMTLWERWDDFDPERGVFFYWAVGIARNHMCNHVRQCMSRGKYVLFDTDLLEELANTQTENADFYEEQYQALSKCLEKLSPRRRSLVENFYGRTVSIADVASTHGLSRSALYRHLESIRKTLFNCIMLRTAPGGA